MDVDEAAPPEAAPPAMPVNVFSKMRDVVAPLSIEEWKPRTESPVVVLPATEFVEALLQANASLAIKAYYHPSKDQFEEVVANIANTLKDKLKGAVAYLKLGSHQPLALFDGVPMDIPGAAVCDGKAALLHSACHQLS